jgi:hypothetical protein
LEKEIQMNLKIKVGECGLDSFVAGYGQMAGSYEHGNELPVSIKRGIFLIS